MDKIRKLNFRTKKAFTLAEVLVTLGIIGLISAMTMPTLIQNYKNMVVSKRMKAFYSDINQAIRLAEVDYGSCTYWHDTGTTNIDEQKLWLEKYIIPYMNVVKSKRVVNGGREMNAFQLNNGSWFLVTDSNNRDWTFFPGDIDKCLKKTDYFYEKFTGRCGFAFGWGIGTNSRCSLEPFSHTLGLSPSRDAILNHPSYGCNSSSSGWKAFCTKLIQMNNWEIPKDYPFKIFY